MEWFLTVFKLFLEEEHNNRQSAQYEDVDLKKVEERFNAIVTDEGC